MTGRVVVTGFGVGIVHAALVLLLADLERDIRSDCIPARVRGDHAWLVGQVRALVGQFASVEVSGLTRQ